MKGLLLKDFCILKKQMKLMVVFVIFYAIWAVAAKMPTMMGTMVILLSIMMPISSMSYDEAGQWYRYAFSLPIPRRTLVLSKYVLGFLVSLGGLVVSAIGNIIILALTNGENALESWLTIIGFLELGVIFLSIIIPHIIQIRCGERPPFNCRHRGYPLPFGRLAGKYVENLRYPHAQRRTPAGNFVFLSSVYPGDFSNFLPHFSGNLPKKRILKIPVFL